MIRLDAEVVPARADATTIERYPLFQSSVDLAPGVETVFTIDLSSVPPAGVETPERLKITGLPSNWQKVTVGIEVASAHVDFKSPRGEIELHRDNTSVPCVLHGTVKQNCVKGQTISITTIFLLDGRIGGFLRRNFILGEGPPAPVKDSFPLDFRSKTGTDRGGWV